MQNGFTNRPEESAMVTEKISPRETGILCIDCGWESSVVNPDAAKINFMLHPCKIRIQSISRFR